MGFLTEIYGNFLIGEFVRDAREAIERMGDACKCMPRHRLERAIDDFSIGDVAFAECHQGMRLVRTDCDDQLTGRFGAEG